MPAQLSTIFYTLAFIVPGFVLDVAFYAGQRQPERTGEISMVRWLALACLNYALWSPLVYLLLDASFLAGVAHRNWYLAALWGVIILAGPVVIGIAAAYFARNDALRRLLHRLGLKPLHPIPAAWDYVFHDIRREKWVYVTLKNGSTVAGLFSGRSFASSDAWERDLYIEQVYHTPPGKPWAPVAGGAGLLIAGSEIRHIEFWDNTEGANRG
jgi:hypothetical protein